MYVSSPIWEPTVPDPSPSKRDRYIERAAKRIAGAFGYAVQFDTGRYDEFYDRDYWRGVAEAALSEVLDENARLRDELREIADCPKRGVKAESTDGQAWNDRAWVIERARAALSPGGWRRATGGGGVSEKGEAMSEFWDRVVTHPGTERLTLEQIDVAVEGIRRGAPSDAQLARWLRSLPADDESGRWLRLAADRLESSEVEDAQAVAEPSPSERDRYIERAAERWHQCPGCWSVNLLPVGKDYECECGEALAVIDLRAEAALSEVLDENERLRKIAALALERTHVGDADEATALLEQVITLAGEYVSPGGGAEQ
jgi:hypothetical protein